MKRFDSVDSYIAGQERWGDQLVTLREVMLDTELNEEVKWGAPCYTLNKKLVVGLAAFKNHYAIWFHQGVFLSDPQKKLLNAQEGTTRGLRQWRFEEGDEIDTKLIKEYVLEAIQNQKDGKEIKPVKAKKVDMPQELLDALGKNAKLKSSFDSLTPGKQREYAEHIGSAKQEKTRLSRLEKSIPLIESGIGLNDKYRK